jgi:hypothetical protein
MILRFAQDDNFFVRRVMLRGIHDDGRSARCAARNMIRQAEVLGVGEDDGAGEDEDAAEPVMPGDALVEK